eukprot:CAMPEP_0116874924 /NCGR_PEP_ID=MMETSP0463-20121206/6559_1 /TAXON_ID=181622 /ORGANISM="Strombidinopsis sp, Strain SopsisLIS2011" /LENGTH=41 /DNA_ID= /DNA_START= /DNA_END= /DNA_ORIENTATION=
MDKNQCKYITLKHGRCTVDSKVHKLSKFQLYDDMDIGLDSL